MIKDEEVYIFKGGAHYTLVEGYPKSLKEELGIAGRVDAAFLCDDDNKVHIIQGQEMLVVDLTATPRVVIERLPLPLSDLDAALCGPNGVDVFKGSQYYHYDSPMLLAMGRMAPVAEDITPEMMGCQK
ncbi:unnamed protein product [Pleuronectes platessa]|uniref:Hemopexin n=2 Tax=Pleuronectes platessa TaxID=8262 RepID=A0A9N7VWX3_PLEPL|nr:unnamed protein product [Pleuronectes platessa]